VDTAIAIVLRGIDPRRTSPEQADANRRKLMERARSADISLNVEPPVPPLQAGQ